MEKSGDFRIENKEEAEVGAYTEKPLRDIARDNSLSITKEEKVALDSVANKQAEAAIREFSINKTTSSEVSAQNAPEAGPASLVERGLTLIRESNDIEYVVCAIGNVLGVPGKDTDGVSTYIFNHKTQAMEPIGGVGFLDTNDRGPYVKEESFSSQWSIRNKEEYTYIKWRLPFKAKLNEANEYVTDHRDGVHFTAALRFRLGDIEKIEDTELRQKLQTAAREVSKDVIDNFAFPLLYKCSEEFVPRYFNNLIRLFKEKQGQSDKKEA